MVRFNSVYSNPVETIDYYLSDPAPAVPSLCSIGSQHDPLPSDPSREDAEIQICSDAGIYGFSTLETFTVTLNDAKDGTPIVDAVVLVFVDGVSLPEIHKTNVDGMAVFGYINWVSPTPPEGQQTKHSVFAVFMGN